MEKDIKLRVIEDKIEKIVKWDGMTGLSHIPDTVTLDKEVWETLFPMWGEMPIYAQKS